MTGPNVILTLKIAVIAVSLLLGASLTCLALGRYRLHGRINIVFFMLTLIAVLGLETVTSLKPGLFNYFTEDDRQNMAIHLSFSIPSTILLPLMLISGLTHRRRLH